MDWLACVHREFICDAVSRAVQSYPETTSQWGKELESHTSWSNLALSPAQIWDTSEASLSKPMCITWTAGVHYRRAHCRSCMYGNFKPGEISLLMVELTSWLGTQGTSWLQLLSGVVQQHCPLLCEASLWCSDVGSLAPLPFTLTYLQWALPPHVQACAVAHKHIFRATLMIECPPRPCIMYTHNFTLTWSHSGLPQQLHTT